jgi:hypothetical protein
MILRRPDLGGRKIIGFKHPMKSFIVRTGTRKSRLIFAQFVSHSVDRYVTRNTGG